ncbi:MAG: hypothetical protein A2Y17_05250 [Clostridiales bacterium GWF2_38_85]|nr:MAG: hypothetical protein A2Y17_05250 [Clostridiales bacterium GWF2_38_85]HBL83364.1 hypothetical protein [Clostridiales bacterium]
MLKFEIKKLLYNKILWISLIAVLIYSFSMFYGSVLKKEVYYNQNTVNTDNPEIIYNNRMEKIKLEKELVAPYIGKELDDDLVTELLILYYDLREEGKECINTAPHTMIWMNFFPIAYNENAEISEGYRIITINNEKYKVETVEQFYKTVNANKPIVFEYGEGWIALTERLGWSLIVGLAVIVISLAAVFSGEHKYRMFGQITSTKNGKNKNVKSKVLASLIITSAMFFIITAVNMLMYLSVYGLSGGDTDLLLSVLANTAFLNLNIAGITVMNVFISTIVCGFIAYIAVAMLTLFISSLLNNDYISVVVSSVLYFFPMILTKMFRFDNSEVLVNTLNLMPINIFPLRLETGNWHWQVSDISLFNFNLPSIYIISFSYLIISIISFLLIRIHIKKMQDI